VGDVMSPEQRSRVMSRIRSKNTTPELAIERELLIRGLKFERHCNDLPGKPDFTFRQDRVAVFVDGDFWHGYRFPLWEHKLSPKWREKISGNRRRDSRNFASLRRKQWIVVRIWEHQVARNVTKCVDRITEAIDLSQGC
jgi:DNA mismatch endonuclease (patch repair protein)